MNVNNGLVLVSPRVTPVLDPCFRPAVLANRAFRREALASGKSVSIRIALEQTDASVITFSTEIFPEGHLQMAANFTYIERLVKALLWSRGGFRLYFDGPCVLAEQLRQRWRATNPGRFEFSVPRP